MQRLRGIFWFELTDRTRLHGARGSRASCPGVAKRLGPIDLLVVNHGIGSAHEKLVWEQDPAVWRETMRINLDGPFELARLTVGGMCKRGFGRLVFTSSTAGEKAERSGSAYTASKHGLIGLARAVAQLRAIERLRKKR